MSKYKSQVILTFNADPGIADDAKAYQKRAEQFNVSSGIAALGPPSLGDQDPPVEDVKKATRAFIVLDALPSRLYLTGHGVWQAQTIGGWTAAKVAKLLKLAKLPSVTMVSVTGCSLGRDNGAAGIHRIAASLDSFAGHLHRLLKSECGIETTLQARVFDVTTNRSDYMVGQKRTGNANEGWQNAIHKRDFSKLTFKWENGRQQRFWAYSGESTAQEEFDLKFPVLNPTKN